MMASEESSTTWDRTGEEIKMAQAITNDNNHLRVSIRPSGQAVKTSPFHGGNPSSNLGRVTREPLFIVALIIRKLSSVG